MKDDGKAQQSKIIGRITSHNLGLKRRGHRAPHPNGHGLRSDPWGAPLRADDVTVRNDKSIIRDG